MKTTKEKTKFLNNYYRQYKLNKISFDDYLYIEQQVRSENGKADNRITELVTG